MSHHSLQKNPPPDPPPGLPPPLPAAMVADALQIISVISAAFNNRFFMSVSQSVMDGMQPQA